MLYHLPLEPYLERYTAQLLSWYTDKWTEAKVEYASIVPENIFGQGNEPLYIKSGVVLDSVRRSQWAMSQIDGVLSLIDQGKIKSSDTILFDDFWHPGIEAIPYACHFSPNKPKMYAFLWAQSVDRFDFTHPMRRWMRHFEKGIGEVLDGIFVANSILKDEVVYAGIAPESKVHVVGLPFNSEQVIGQMPLLYHDAMNKQRNHIHGKRRNQIVFSSRFDKEKNPMFFLNMMKILQHTTIPGLKGIVCTSANQLRSNYPEAVEELKKLQETGLVEVWENLSKEGYYKLLTESKIQFNCALQDWVSFTLLEASVAGCYPIYPYFRSFPETFSPHHEFMYTPWDLNEAALKVMNILKKDTLWTYNQIKSREWIHKRFDDTWKRILYHMDIPFQSLNPFKVFPYEVVINGTE